jgi:hypothetical protein
MYFCTIKQKNEMNNNMEIVIDVLFSITDLDAYELHIIKPNEERKHISHFKRPIYVGDIVSLSQDDNGFTVITIDEDGERKKIRAFETIEEIQIVMNKMEILNRDESIFNFLNQKLENLNKKSPKKIGNIKK